MRTIPPAVDQGNTQFCKAYGEKPTVNIPIIILEVRGLK